MLVGTNNTDALRAVKDVMGRGYRVDEARDAGACLELFRRKRYEFTFLDISFLRVSPNQGRQAFDLAFQPFRHAFPAALIVVLSPPSSIREAVMAVKAGADGYLCYPIDPDEVAYLTEDLQEWQKIESELRYLREKQWRDDADLVEQTRSPLMTDMLEKIRLVAPTRTTVLLTGETGTGKGLLARLIHRRSSRSDGPFISVHCGAIPENLIESELFGHEKGAFTGAIRRKLGQFQIADGGTIFLDEIGTISPMLQVKLLQVLQEGRFTRLGGESSIDADVRIVAASNMDLRQLCQQGVFRLDLYYRLSGFVIELPPLRYRLEDVPLLVDLFIANHNRSNQGEIAGLAPGVLNALKKYAWPGNIRELENLIERACILADAPILAAAAFPRELFEPDTVGPAAPASEIPNLAEIKHRAQDEAEARYLDEIMTLSQGRMIRAASLAGVTTRHLRNLLKRHGLEKERYRPRFQAQGKR